MLRTIALAGAALLASTLTPLLAEEDAESLSGEFYTLPADAEAGLPASLFFALDGEAAKALYEGLAAPAEDNECIGGKTKFLTDGSGYCHSDEEAGAFFCSFSVDLESGKFSGGESC
jgi:hypothetical protein